MSELSDIGKEVLKTKALLKIFGVCEFLIICFITELIGLVELLFDLRSLLVVMNWN